MNNPNIPQPQDESHDPLIGKQFQGYQFKARLGQGTFGVVYLAQHPRLNKEVAVKYLEPRSPQEARTVKKEVDLMAELSHPRIVRIEDHYLEDTPETAQEQKHRHWIMMQYVSGGSLRRMMKDLKRLDMRMTVTVLDQMAAALDFLHGREYIHLDLKPENILVESAPGMDVPNFFLADFGVAQLARRQLASPAGTPVYMSPEQFAANSSPDRRADVYALGVILYELVVGFPPFRAATVNELAFQHSNAQPPSPTKVVAGLSEPVSEVILRALQKQPEARFGTAGELSAALRLAAGGEGQAASAVARDMQRMAGSYAEQVRAYSQRGTALHLFMMGADGVERPQSFLKSAVVLGSDPRVDLPLNDPNIAPQQVRVEWQPDGSLTVTDLVGNGITYLDDRALPPGQPVNWGFGQYLMVRGFMLRAGIEAGQELSARQFANLLNKVQERYRKPRIQMLVTPEVVQVRVGRPQYLRVAIKPEFASVTTNYRLEVRDVPGGINRSWLTLPAPRTLAPGESHSFDIVVNAPMVEAGTYDLFLGVVADDTSVPDVAQVVRVNVERSIRYTISLKPDPVLHRRFFRRPAELTIQNDGTYAETFSIDVSPSDRLLARPSVQEVLVPRDQARKVRIRLTPLRGAREIERLKYTVKVRAKEAGEEQEKVSQYVFPPPSGIGWFERLRRLIFLALVLAAVAFVVLRLSQGQTPAAIVQEVINAITALWNSVRAALGGATS